MGTTAALLAAASDSQSETSLGRTGHSRGDSSRDIHSVNAEQAAYLDQLVEVGDWEGVVTAAAKFEAQTGLSDSPNGGGDSALQQRSTTARSVEASGGANSNGRSNEALGRHVIPQEIDTVNTPLNPLDGQESQY